MMKMLKDVKIGDDTFRGKVMAKNAFTHYEYKYMDVICTEGVFTDYEVKEIWIFEKS